MTIKTRHPIPTTAPTTALFVEVELGTVCVSFIVGLPFDDNTVAVVLLIVVDAVVIIVELGKVIADRVAGFVETILPYWSIVVFVMLKYALKANGAVSLGLNSWKLNWFSNARSSFGPPSLPSTVTFQLYVCCVNTTDHHSPS